jgi:hypothetical protein
VVDLRSIIFSPTDGKDIRDVSWRSTCRRSLNSGVGGSDGNWDLCSLLRRGDFLGIAGNFLETVICIL